MDFFTYDSPTRNRYGFSTLGSGSSNLLFGGQFNPFPRSSTTIERPLLSETRSSMNPSLDIPVWSSSFRLSPALPVALNTSFLSHPKHSASFTSPSMNVESLYSPPQSIFSPKPKCGPSLHAGPSLDILNFPNSFKLGGQVSVDNINVCSVERISGDLSYTFNRTVNFFERATPKPTISLSIGNLDIQAQERRLDAQCTSSKFRLGWTPEQLNRVCRASVQMGYHMNSQVKMGELHNHTDAELCVYGRCPVAERFNRLDYLTLELRQTSGSDLTSVRVKYHAKPHPKADDTLELGVRHSWQRGNAKHQASAGYTTPLSAKPQEKSALQVGWESFWSIF